MIKISDRKRRMFLCLTLPQNLSSKKLSFKDIRFLQKTLRNVKESLSFNLIKQQKLLYNKHIHSNLKFEPAKNRYLESLTQTEYFEKNPTKQRDRRDPKQVSLIEGYKYDLDVFPNNRSLVPGKTTEHFVGFLPERQAAPLGQPLRATPKINDSMEVTRGFSLENKAYGFLKRHPQKNSESIAIRPISNKLIAVDYIPLSAPVAPLDITPKAQTQGQDVEKRHKPYINNCTTPIYFQIWQKSQKYVSVVPKSQNERILEIPPEKEEKVFMQDGNQNLLRVSTSKVGAKTVGLHQKCKRKAQYQIILPKGYFPCRSSKVYKKSQASPFYSQDALCIYAQSIKTPISNFHREHQNVSKTKSHISVFLDKGFSFDICKAYACSPIFVNGHSQNLYCRYLYHKEHIKTCINPQVLQNPSLANKAKILHEKKKISLFYGSLSKKDTITLCKNATLLPGSFEDNMYTLLESRVDVLVYRAGFSKTIAMARQLIRRGTFLFNGRPLCSTKVRGKPGDVLCLSPENFKVLISRYKQTTKILSDLYFQRQPSSAYASKKIIFRALAHRAHENYKTSLCPVGKGKAFPVSPLHQKFSFIKKHPLFSPKIHGSYQKPFTFDYYTYNVSHYLYPGFLFYQNLCKKHVLDTSFFKNQKCFLFGSEPRNFLYNGFYAYIHTHNILNVKRSVKYSKNLQCVYLNVYCAFLLKYKKKNRKTFYGKASTERIFDIFMKNIQNANCASIWGQKPLHLEISHKTTTFIYLYRPQKLVSPMCMDFSVYRA